LKDGKVAENGTPRALMERENSIVHCEVKKASKKFFKYLLGAVGIHIPKKSVIELLKAAEKDAPRSQKVEPLLRKLFDCYDADGSGELDKGEISCLLADTCKELDIPNLSDKDLDELINFCDDSGDGQFNFDELYDMVAPILLDEM
jgi:Ca2+-binding EF-hand superfamily protein